MLCPKCKYCSKETDVSTLNKNQQWEIRLTPKKDFSMWVCPHCFMMNKNDDLETFLMFLDFLKINIGTQIANKM